MFRFALFSFAFLVSAFIAAADSEDLSAMSPSAFRSYLSENLPHLGLDWCPVTALSSQDYGGTLIRQPVTSPDGRFSIELNHRDRDYYFTITDHKLKKTVELPNVYRPVFAFEWSPDSKTVLSVEHAAQTSLIEILHFDGSHWKSFNIDPPLAKGDNYRFHAVHWDFTDDSLVTTYAVNNNEVRNSTDLYKVTFKVNVKTGGISHVTSAPLTVSEYIDLRTARN